MGHAVSGSTLWCTALDIEAGLRIVALRHKKRPRRKRLILLAEKRVIEPMASASRHQKQARRGALRRKYLILWVE